MRGTWDIRVRFETVAPVAAELHMRLPRVAHSPKPRRLGEEAGE
jgi:hypothetical protein